MGQLPILGSVVRRGAVFRQTVASINHQVVVLSLLVPLHTGPLPDECDIPPSFHPLVDFVINTTQFLYVIGGVVLLFGLVASGVYWIVSGPAGKQRAMEFAKHTLLGGLMLVMAKPIATWILSSFPAVCGGGG